MPLSRFARNLISRATALCVGLAWAYACLRCVSGIAAAAHDADLQRAQTSAGSRVVGAQPLQFVLVAITGLPALVLIGFAVLPTRVLHSINPSPSRTDGRDIAQALLESAQP